MKIGDFVVYKPMWNIDTVYKIIDINLVKYDHMYGDINYIVMKDSSSKTGYGKFAHKSEIQLANEQEIARYIAGLLTNN